MPVSLVHRVPRASGDEPIIPLINHARVTVFPAPAGMNRGSCAGNGWRAGVPRASGDEPLIGANLTNTPQCSPRQRG